MQFGAEAIENFDGLEDTTLATWFKIHLHPEKMRVENRLTSPPLPKCVNIKTVYTDFLSYLFSHARNFLNESSLVGREGLFDRLKDNFVVVLAIPNGWDSAQQAFLRDAVVSAGILSVNHDRDRLQFVSEAEASVHFAINYARIGNWLREGMQLAVCDAGGSTLDTTVYTCISAAPRLQLKETTSSECVQAGSVFVDEAARSFLGGKLASSTKYGSPEVIECMVRTFEKKTVSSVGPLYSLFFSLIDDFRSASLMASRTSPSLSLVKHLIPIGLMYTLVASRYLGLYPFILPVLRLQLTKTD